MPKIAVVIPCYKVREKILSVIKKIPDMVSEIIVVDDHCPDLSGAHVRDSIYGKRVKLIFHKENMGVGGAVISGYDFAIENECEIVIKVDGDGQMNPTLIPLLLEPILSGKADYVKGNRFYSIESIKTMPKIRVFGNILLSFINKFSSGYWSIMDPTNGFTAIHIDALKLIPLNKLHKRFFFESDLLFRLYTVNAKVVDVFMEAIYEDEKSNLRIRKILFPYIMGHVTNFFKRIVYTYFLRDFNFASLCLTLSIPLLLSGFLFGFYQWFLGISNQIPSTAGAVMITALLLITGFQLLLSFFNYDITNFPSEPIQKPKK
jgi:dolichol-phosphate mannosyltransferase